MTEIADDLESILRDQKKNIYFIVKGQCGQCGKGLTVNHFSQVNKSTVLGDHVNFNGMRIGGGNPAKVFKYRDKERFLRLKEEGRFH